MSGSLVALKELKRITKPGRKVVVADLDGNCIFNYPMDRKLIDGIWNVIEIIDDKAGFDPYVGRKLYHYFYRAGLKEINVTPRTYHLIPGSPSDEAYRHWEAKVNILEKNFIKMAPDKYEKLAFAFQGLLDHLKRPDSITYSTIFIVAGIK